MNEQQAHDEPCWVCSGRGCPDCLEESTTVCRSWEWGLCNGIGCPICSPKDAEQ